MKLFFRRESGKARLAHPLDPIPRTAVLAKGIASNGQVRVFPEGWCRKAERFKPAVLAAPLGTLLELAGTGVEVTHALIVFTYDLEECLSEQDRDFLWDAFGVPIFQQVLGPAQELIATECEAHSGLHVVGETDGLELDYRPCGCGSSVPKLRQPEPALEPALALRALA